MNIITSILGTVLRNWLSAMLTILVAKHWINTEQGQGITLWFNGWVDVALTTLAAAAVPALFGIYAKLRDWLKIKVALLMNKGASETELQKRVSHAGVAAPLTQNVRSAMHATVLIILVAVCVTFGPIACQNPPHGELTGGLTVNPTNPSEIDFTAGGKVTFRKRLLTRAEKTAIHDEGFRTGEQFARGERAKDQSAERSKVLLANRIAYRYRVYASIIKPVSDAGFDEGMTSAGSP